MKIVYVYLGVSAQTFDLVRKDSSMAIVCLRFVVHQICHECSGYKAKRYVRDGNSFNVG